MVSTQVLKDVELDFYLYFVQAIYLKTFRPRTFDILMQVRRLAHHFGCGVVIDKCDEVKITLRNAHIVFDNWPNNTGIKSKALELMKG